MSKKSIPVLTPILSNTPIRLRPGVAAPGAEPSDAAVDLFGPGRTASTELAAPGRGSRVVKADLGIRAGSA